MRRRPGRYNAKRQMVGDLPSCDAEALCEQLVYRGNPEHKRNPGDFRLTPPAQPRPDKELCDDVGVFERAQALELLKRGVRLGMVSTQMRGELPQNIWTVTDDGFPVEAQLENQ